ncbi:MAG: TonB-dependent receptor [Pseudosphingobacterium sp.]|nr:TonB-dependent receptor [Pseudosphingobacterium sp.]
MYSFVRTTTSNKHFHRFLLFAFAFFCFSATYAQQNILDKPITLHLYQTKLSDAILSIEKAADCSISYSETFLNNEQLISLDANDIPLSSVLQQMFGDLVKGIRVKGNQISIQPSKGKGTITGTVKTSDGQAAAFVSISIQGQRSTQTDEKGHFTLTSVEAGRHTVQASHLGLRTQNQSVIVSPEETTEVFFTFIENAQHLDEVTVTGQKRKTASVTHSDLPIQDIPLSIQLIDQTLLQQQLTIDVRDAIKNVSGITNTGTYAGGYADYTGRGFAMNGTSNFRRNGIYLNNMSHLYNDNIERIEILKGPASVIYGDIAPGAVMNFVTKKPLDYDYRKFEMKIGEYGLYRPSFDLSGPLDQQHKLLYRVNASYERSNSFIDYVNNQTLLFTPSITWLITPKLSWNIEAAFKNDERTHNAGVVSPDGTTATLDQLPLSRFLGEPNNQFRYRETSLYSDLNYELSTHWRIRNSTFYSNTQDRVEGTYYPLLTPDEEGNIVRSTWMTNFFPTSWGNNLDVVGNVQTGVFKHALAFGIDYLRNENGYNQVESQQMEPINIFNPVYGLTKVIRSNSYPGMEGPKAFFSRTGIYAQEQLSTLQDRLHLFAGLRYNITRQGTEFTNASPAPELYKEDKKNLLSPRIGLVIKPKDWLSLYGSYAQSYEQNGQDMLTGNIIPQTDADQWETGIKTSLLNDRLGIGLAAFRINKENVFGYVYNLAEEPDFPHLYWDPDTKIASYLGGHHRSKGIELDVNGVLAKGLNVNLAASYIDAYVVQDPAFATGNQLRGNAKKTANFWAHYQFQQGALQGFSLGWGIFYKDGFYTNSNNDPTKWLDSFWSMDASAGYNYRNVFARLNVSNLTDNIGYLGTAGYTPLWVRRAVLSFGVQF